MIVVVDGVIYQLQKAGGISRLFTEVLPRMCNLDPSLEIEMWVDKTRNMVDPLQPLPIHPHITHRTIPALQNRLRPNKLWRFAVPHLESVMRRLQLRYGQDAIWHSTYYTLPAKWKGMQVVTVADMIHEFFPDLFDRPYDEQIRKEKRLCIENATAVITISEATKNDVLSVYNVDPARVHVTYLAYNSGFKQMGSSVVLERQLEKPFLLYVGRRMHYKNFDGFLKAYACWEGRKDVDVVVVGWKTWMPQEKHLMESLGIAQHIHLLRDIDDHQLCLLYNQAAAFLYPSLYEGFGIPLLEAMACGCPVIVSDIPSSKEIAAEHPIYFDVDDADQMVEAFNIALSEGRDSERVRKGLQHVRRYTWDHTAEETLKVYHAIH